jgi:hypothetical protein
MEAENVIFGVMYAVVGMVLLAISIPLKDGEVAMNHVFGVRMRKSFTSEKNWFLMNSYGGKQLFRWSWVLFLVSIVALFFPFNGNDLFIALFAFMPLVVLSIPICLIVRYSRTLSDC